MDLKNGRLAARSRGRVFCRSDEKLVGHESPVRERELPFARSLVGLTETAETYRRREPNGLASLGGSVRGGQRLRNDCGARDQCSPRSDMPIHRISWVGV